MKDTNCSVHVGYGAIGSGHIPAELSIDQKSPLGCLTGSYSVHQTAPTQHAPVKLYAVTPLALHAAATAAELTSPLHVGG